LKKRLIIGGVIAIVLLTPAFYGEYMRRAELRELKEERRLASLAGLPLSIEDLKPKARFPDSENAAIPLREAHLLLSSSDAADRLGVTKEELQDAKSFLQGRRLTVRLNQEPQAAEALVRVYARPLDLAREAARRPYYYFDRKWDAGAVLPFPEFTSFRQIIHSLLVASWIKASKGRRDEALEDMVAAARICRLVREEPTSIATIISTSGEAVVLMILQALQKKNPSDTFWLYATGPVLAAFGPPVDVRHSLGLEIFAMTTGLDAFMKPDAEETFGNLEGRSRTYIRRDRRAQTEMQVLRAYRTLFTNWPKDPNDYLEIRKVAQKPAEQIDLALSGFSSVISQMSAGSQDAGIIGSTAMAGARSLARRRLAQIYADCLIAKLKSGEFPSELPARGNLATDPFSKMAFEYRRTLDGFIVYSIGENLVDDDGASRPPEGEQGRPPDIVLRYP